MKFLILLLLFSVQTFAMNTQDITCLNDIGINPELDEVALIKYKLDENNINEEIRHKLLSNDFFVLINDQKIHVKTDVKTLYEKDYDRRLPWTERKKLRLLSRALREFSFQEKEGNIHLQGVKSFYDAVSDEGGQYGTVNIKITNPLGKIDIETLTKEKTLSLSGRKSKLVHIDSKDPMGAGHYYYKGTFIYSVSVEVLIDEYGDICLRKLD